MPVAINAQMLERVTNFMFVSVSPLSTCVWSVCPFGLLWVLRMLCLVVSQFTA